MFEYYSLYLSTIWSESAKEIDLIFYKSQVDLNLNCQIKGLHINYEKKFMVNIYSKKLQELFSCCWD